MFFFIRPHEKLGKEMKKRAQNGEKEKYIGELNRWFFLDESAANERTLDRKYGWAPVGLEASIISPFHRSTRWSILPAYTIEGYIDFEIYQGSYNTERFSEFVRSKALPKMTPFADGGPRSILVLDNAKIHHSAELTDMCLDAGIVLVYLPPSSCNYNPIKTLFAVLKQ